MINCFKPKNYRHAIGGRKDDVRIDGAAPRWPSPVEYSLVQKIGIGVFAVVLLAVVPLAGLLILTGLNRPIERYYANDATLGISPEISNWWAGGNYRVDLE
jgi:hypothetical protein